MPSNSILASTIGFNKESCTVKSIANNGHVAVSTTDSIISDHAIVTLPDTGVYPNLYTV